jgi:hypothetical protein
MSDVMEAACTSLAKAARASRMSQVAVMRERSSTSLELDWNSVALEEAEDIFSEVTKRIQATLRLQRSMRGFLIRKTAEREASAAKAEEERLQRLAEEAELERLRLLEEENRKREEALRRSRASMPNLKNYNSSEEKPKKKVALRRSPSRQKVMTIREEMDWTPQSRTVPSRQKQRRGQNVLDGAGGEVPHREGGGGGGGEAGGGVGTRTRRTTTNVWVSLSPAFGDAAAARTHRQRPSSASCASERGGFVRRTVSQAAAATAIATGRPSSARLASPRRVPASRPSSARLASPRRDPAVPASTSGGGRRDATQPSSSALETLKDKDGGVVVTRTGTVKGSARAPRPKSALPRVEGVRLVPTYLLSFGGLLTPPATALSLGDARPWSSAGYGSGRGQEGGAAGGERRVGAMIIPLLRGSMEEDRAEAAFYPRQKEVKDVSLKDVNPKDGMVKRARSARMRRHSGDFDFPPAAFNGESAARGGVATAGGVTPPQSTHPSPYCRDCDEVGGGGEDWEGYLPPPSLSPPSQNLSVHSPPPRAPMNTPRVSTADSWPGGPTQRSVRSRRSDVRETTYGLQVPPSPESSFRGLARGSSVFIHAEIPTQPAAAVAAAAVVARFSRPGIGMNKSPVNGASRAGKLRRRNSFESLMSLASLDEARGEEEEDTGAKTCIGQDSSAKTCIDGLKLSALDLSGGVRSSDRGARRKLAHARSSLS